MRVQTYAHTQAWECLTTERPWAKHESVIQIITAVLVSQERLALPSTVPAEMAALPDLIKDCWQVNPWLYLKSAHGVCHVGPMSRRPYGRCHGGPMVHVMMALLHMSCWHCGTCHGDPMAHIIPFLLAG